MLNVLTDDSSFPERTAGRICTPAFTPRQQKILHGIAWGYSSLQIGDWLGQGEQEVDSQLERILLKLGARNEADAVRIAASMGFSFEADPIAAENPEEAQAPGAQVSAIASFLGDASGARFAQAQPGDDPEGNRSPATVRAIGTRDSTYGERLAWIVGSLSLEAEYVYQDWQTRLISQADSHFDALLVHGADARRIAKIVRDLRNCLPCKIIIVLLNAANATERASAFRNGADAVYSLHEDGAVARAWLGCAMARQETKVRVQSAPAITPLASLLQGKSFQRMEIESLKLLEQRAGRTVPFKDFLGLSKRQSENASVKSVHVRMSVLNAKLQGILAIENVRGEGYRIAPTAVRSAIGVLSSDHRCTAA